MSERRARAEPALAIGKFFQFPISNFDYRLAELYEQFYYSPFLCKRRRGNLLARMVDCGGITCNGLSPRILKRKSIHLNRQRAGKSK